MSWNRSQMGAHLLCMFALGCAVLPESLASSGVTLSTLTMTPESVAVNVGSSLQFNITGTWSDGSTTIPPVTYSATGGTVAQSGIFSAGTVPGEFIVLVEHVPSGKRDTSKVAVQVPAGTLANECASPRTGWIWCDDFDSNRLASYFEVDSADGSFTRTNGVGNNGSYGMRARWSIGQVSAGALHLALGLTPQPYIRSADAGGARHRDLYWRIYLRNQAGWVGGGGDKLSRAFVFASPASFAQAMIAHVWSGDDDSNYENVLALDPARGTDANGILRTTGYNDFANLSFLGIANGTVNLFAPSNVGIWHCIEARARLNDAGMNNGVTELWIDGVMDASRSGLNFLGSFDTYGLNAIYLENYWNAGSPAAQERYFDNFVVSTSRIGC